MWTYLIWIPALLLLSAGWFAGARVSKRAARRMTIAFALVVIARLVGGTLLSLADASWLPSAFQGRPTACAGFILHIAILLFAMGIAVRTILSSYEGKRRIARIVFLAVALLAEFFEPIHALNAISILGFLLLALSTKWTKETAGLRRLGLAILAFLAFLTSLIGQSWPERYLNTLLTPGVKILDFLVIFFALHCFFSSFRLAIGVRVRVRRIGRSLLFSHLLAIVVPAALVIAFLMLTTLAGIAGYRAETVEPYLNMRIERMERAMAILLEGAVAEEAVFDPVRLAKEFAAIEPEENVASGTLFLRSGGIDEAEEPLLFLSPIATAERNRHPLPDDPEAWLIPETGWVSLPDSSNGIVLVRGRLFLIARNEAERDDGFVLRALLIREVPSGRIGDLELALDAPIRINTLVSVNSQGGGVQVSFGNEQDRAEAEEEEALWDREDGAEEESNRRDGLAIPGGAFLTIHEYDREAGSWTERPVAITSRAWPGDLFHGLTGVRENRMNLIALVLLLLLALLFLVVVGVVLGTVISMNRGIAAAIGRLTGGARRLREGDLANRIEVVGEDELAGLAREFNRMAEGLEEGRRVALEKERVEGELAIAREIQRKLLPAGPPEVAGLEVAGISTPAREVGGDYYDFFLSEDGRLVFAIADVSGKGVPAALLMSSMSASFHAYAAGHLDPAAAAAKLNAFLYASTKAESFITGFLAVVDGPEGVIRFVNAGHEPPVLIHGDGRIETVEGGGLMLGAFPEAPYEEATVRLETGDLLLLYTDGVTEAMNREESFFSMERLLEEAKGFAGLTAGETLQRLTAAIRGWVGDAEQSDDITLVALRKR
ncbi:MAG: PP2C family protein-serine/threonine phosphatase [Candidatus Eisenbacteria bacterium]|nr:PP2C family protein-serine/threonine phosphatase [Candidatus Eisenbacteria bacterium]